MDSGPKTREYRTLEGNLSRIIDCLSATVDPGNLALKLRENHLVTTSTVDSATIIHGMTRAQRLLPVLRAVLAQVELVASKYHDFVAILKDCNPVLADVLCKYFSTNLALNVGSAVEEVSDWKALGHQLDVNQVKLCELQQSDRNPEDCKEELLIFWVEHDRSASWKKLVRALDRMEEQDVAQRIREKYSYTQGEDELEVTVNDCCDVAKRIENFEERFSSLEFATLLELEEKKTSLKRFRHSITLLPVAIKRDHKRFLEESLSDITKVESLDQLFMHLNLYWNFLDYSLLEHIINRFGSATLKQQMKTYASDLFHFRKSTTVRQFVSNCPGSCCRRVEPLPPHFSKIMCKLDRKASEYTLEELEQTRKKFCREFSLSEFVVTLGDIEDGSVTVWWIVPSVIVPELTTAVRNRAATFVEDCRVLLLAVDGWCVFDRQKGVIAKVHSPQRLPQRLNGEESTDHSAIAVHRCELVVGTKPLLHYIDGEQAKLLFHNGSSASTQTKEITKPICKDQDEGCELVVGTKPLLHYIDGEQAKLLFHNGSSASTQTKEITKPICEDQDEGYGTQKLATAVDSGLLGSCESNPNSDEEGSQGVYVRPINVTDELQEDKIETETARSTQIMKPICEEQDEGYGTTEIATTVYSGLLGSCESNPNPDEEGSQGVHDRPINVTDELQEGKSETETARSTQKLHTLLSCPSAPGTSRHAPHNKLACTAIELARMPPSNSSTEHRLKLLDTGQLPGENNSTSEDTWCSECSPS